MIPGPGKTRREDKSRRESIRLSDDGRDHTFSSAFRCFKSWSAHNSEEQESQAVLTHLLQFKSLVKVSQGRKSIARTM